MKKLSFLILIVITLFSCKKCPDDIKLGEAFLSKTSLDFISYTGNEYLTFKNSRNETIDFAPSEFAGYKAIDQILYTTCTAAWPIKPSYNYVTIDIKNLEYHNDSIYLFATTRFKSVDVLNPAEIDTNWVETVSGQILDQNNRNDSSFFSIITNKRGKEVLPQDILTYNNYLLHDNITILDSTFYNVYSDVNENIFINNNGIVGFVYNGELYKIDEIK